MRSTQSRFKSICQNVGTCNSSCDNNDNVFSELGISKILQNKMQSLFASTQSITKVKEDSLIYRCILTSYAASAEKGEQLCRAIKGRIDLSQDIKKFIFRYFNYEEE